MKLAAALSPLITAALTSLGVVVTGAQVELWIIAAFWIAAAAGAGSPSVRAWLLYRGAAD